MASLRSCRACLEALPPRLGSVSGRRAHPRTASKRITAAATAAAASAATEPPRRPFHSTSGRRQDDTSKMQKIIANHTAKGVKLPYEVYGGMKNVLEHFSEQAPYTISPEARKNGEVPRTEDGEEIGVGSGPWHTELGLLPTFSTWAQVTMLHMYLSVVRFRCMDPEAYESHQKQLVDTFFYEAEERMDVQHGMSSRAARQHHLKDVFTTWRGVVMAYDEGLVRGDAALAAAVWRNLFKARGDVDLRRLAAVVSWMRATLVRLERVPDDDVMFALARVSRSSSPARELPFVDVPAKELVAVLPAARGDGQEPAKAPGS